MTNRSSTWIRTWALQSDQTKTYFPSRLSAYRSMNLTNDSGKPFNEKNTSSDDEEDEENHPMFENPPSIRIENFFSDHEQEEIDSSDADDDNDDEDEDASDIENHYYSKSQLPTQNRLSSLLRQSNRLVELKLNICDHRLICNQQQSLRHALSDSDMSKRSYHYQTHQQQQDQQQSILLASFSSNNFHLSSTRSQRLYLPSSFLYDIQTQITTWLQASTCLIDSIVTSSTYHRRCWPQLLLTYFIEQGMINLEFIRCTHSLSLTTMNDETCSIHKHGCILEDEAYKLCSILQKGSKFRLDASVFDHIRRIIVIKSMQEGNVNTHLRSLCLCSSLPSFF